MDNLFETILFWIEQLYGQHKKLAKLILNIILVETTIFGLLFLKSVPYQMKKTSIHKVFKNMKYNCAAVLKVSKMA